MHSVSARWVACSNAVPEFVLLAHTSETSLTCVNLCPIRPGVIERRRLCWVLGSSTMMYCPSLFCPFLLFRLIIILHLSFQLSDFRFLFIPCLSSLFSLFTLYNFIYLPFMFMIVMYFSQFFHCIV